MTRCRTLAINNAGYRASGWQIGTGMMESSSRQLVGPRLKSPGMRWTEPGAITIAALGATNLNGKMELPLELAGTVELITTN
jgi:hypothetical protein